MKKTIIILFCMCIMISGYSQELSKSPKFRFSIGSGPGIMIASAKEAKKNLTELGFSKSDADKYYNRLKLSFPVETYLHYLINQTWGLGLHYNYFGTSSSLVHTIYDDNGIDMLDLKIEEQINLNFVGPSVFICEFIGPAKKLMFSGAYSIGYLSYRNEPSIVNQKYLITGKTMGITGDIGMEYLISSHTAFGMSLSYLRGAFTKLDVSNGYTTVTNHLGSDNAEDVSRVSLTAGVKFYF